MCEIFLYFNLLRKGKSKNGLCGKPITLYFNLFTSTDETKTTKTLIAFRQNGIGTLSIAKRKMVQQNILESSDNNTLVNPNPDKSWTS